MSDENPVDPMELIEKDEPDWPGEVYGKALSIVLKSYMEDIPHPPAPHGPEMAELVRSLAFQSGWSSCWKYLAKNGFPEIRVDENPE